MKAPILNQFAKTSVPDVHTGDVVRVHQKIVEGGKERVQVFEGIVIATHAGKGLDASFTVRKIASGVGVERTFPMHSDNIAKLEFKKGSDVRRAKLYYLRDLSGKSLRMKEKQIDKETWELIAKPEVAEEASEADIQEAVEHQEEITASEAISNEATTEETVENNNETASEAPVAEATAEPVIAEEAPATNDEEEKPAE